MSRRRRKLKTAPSSEGLSFAAAPSEDAVPPRPGLWLAAAFLLPNLGALFCGFVLDDLPLIVENEKLHSLSRLGEIWRSGYWPDRHGLTLYRPFAQSVQSLLWAAGGGVPLVFHAFNLALGVAAVLLAWRLLEYLASPRAAFFGALLFALFPIHTEATTSVVGAAELLATVLGLAGLLLWRRGSSLPALALFAAAVLSKESAAALAGVAALLAFLDPAWQRPARRILAEGAGAAGIVLLALGARSRVASGPSFVPAVDNAMALVDPFRRVLTALWTQVLYVQKTLLPATLSADYSYKEIPLVMGLDDARAWAGLGLAAAAAYLFARKPALRPGLALWVVPFLPASNLLFPVGTAMGERLAYLPSLGAALLLGRFFARTRRGVTLGLATLAVVFAARTAVRNLDWQTADTFYPKLAATSPDSAKAHYFLGALHASRGRDAEAVAEYDEAVRIFPAYSEAFHNRGNALARLGRREAAMESYRQCLRFDPGHAGAARNLAALEAGLSLAPPRRKL